MILISSAFLLSLGIGFVSTAAISALFWYAHGHRVTPDGSMYLMSGRGEPTPRPYLIRWLGPLLLRTNVTAWYWTALLSTWLATSTVIYIATLVTPMEPVTMLALAIMYLALPINRLNLRYVPLVDAPAIATALIAALLLATGHLSLALLLSLISGSFKETGPLLATLTAAMVVSPLTACTLLLGMMSPLLARVLMEPGPIPEAYRWLTSPAASARQSRGPGILAGSLMILPWGLFPILLAFSSFSVVTLLALLLFYGQMIVANDATRLYQWSAPVVLLAVAPLISSLSPGVLFLACLVQIFNPYSEVPI